MRLFSKMLLIALLTPLSATANNEICNSFGNLATTIMEERQKGILISEMMRRAETLDTSVKETAILFVIAAYDRPQYNLPESRSRAVQRFANDKMLACYKLVQN
ncbi:hypothetical protein SuNHUV7_04900 (plasmid) [Pseudoseohaeicola sp. NH-UV-7]|uniref:hypothetical protein n=1 Tax=Sulfitobacter sp. TBRI5 TaxID=2989732 RepID=UPI003A69B02D